MNLYETVWIARNGQDKGVAQEKFFVTEDQPIFKAFSTKTSFRGRKWISLGGPLGHYFVDCIVLVGQSKHLTVFILDRDAKRLVGKTINEAST